MINLTNIIDLNSYIRISSIKESFEDNCLYVNNEDQLKDVCKYKNIIFKNSKLKNQFYEYLNLHAIDYTVINCLSSLEIFENSLYDARGLVIFDNICCCRNNDMLERVMNYKKSKMLVC